MGMAGGDSCSVRFCDTGLPVTSCCYNGADTLADERAFAATGPDVQLTVALTGLYLEGLLRRGRIRLKGPVIFQRRRLQRVFSELSGSPGAWRLAKSAAGSDGACRFDTWQVEAKAAPTSFARKSWPKLHKSPTIRNTGSSLGLFVASSHVRIFPDSLVSL
jgi:hypothetical protein